MTERLYYNDCHQASFTARITRSQEDGRRIYLDKTCFYPTSGGQPHDTGQLCGCRVIDVVDEDGEIAHLLSEPARFDDTCEGLIDWPRRYDHMQQHTGQHLLSAVWADRFGVETVSFHLGQEVSTIELDTPAVSPEQIALVEQQVNELCREARPVTISFENSLEATGLRRAPERSGTLRVITIAGTDRSACGGTHVRSTAEIAPIQLRGYEKIRGRMRLEFVCGERAGRRSRRDYEILLAASREAGCAMDDVPSAVHKLRARVAEAEKERAHLSIELARSEAAALHDRTAPGSDGLKRIRSSESRIDEATRAKAQAFIERGRAIALISSQDPAVVLLACSNDSGFDASKVLRVTLARAGGSPRIAQGSLSEPAEVESIATQLGF